MKVQAVTHKDKETLKKIKETLLQKWLSSKVNVQNSYELFDSAINPESDQFAYGILLNQKDEILLIASLFAEYKLTRNLCESYHLQVLYKTCGSEEEGYFHKEIAKLLPGYKVIGLNVIESSTFKPYQTFMQNKFYDPTVRGKF